MDARRSALLGAAGLAMLPIGLAVAASPNGTPPGRVTISATPEVVTLGTSAGIGGRVTGNRASAGTQAVLESDTVPFGAFATEATGALNARREFGFTVTPQASTRYRVRIRSAQEIVSPETVVSVRMRVSLRVSDAFPEPGQIVRFYGSVRPPHPGLVLRLQKRNPDRTWRNVARIPVPATASTTTSRYSGEIPITRNGVYRVLAPSHDDHVKAVSAPRLVRTSS
jgi:hypothetical protein